MPEQMSNCTVSISIQRDLEAPYFSNTPYQAEIDENIAVDSTVRLKASNIRASDRDAQVCNILCIRVF